MLFTQSDFDVRCEWGLQGVAKLASISDVVIIIDVLSFTTCVEIATNQGALIYPYKGDNAAEFAQQQGATLAAKWGEQGYSLSPHSLVQLPANFRLVLPSLNGSTLSTSTGSTPTIAGCLRNYQAVATAASGFGKRIAVIPSGERWREDGSLRPAYEDWLGAGAIISQLSGTLSPEARSARAAFLDAKANLAQLMRECGSGKEHLAEINPANVELAAACNVSECVPLLVDGAYRRMGSKS